jgi:hypothetical protein
MEQWNVVPEGRHGFVLLNERSTLIRLSRRVRVDIAALMNEMEVGDVPLAYAREIDEISFTILSGKMGDFLNGRIQVSCGPLCADELPKILVHELAHSLDEIEDLSSDWRLTRERKRKRRHIGDPEARRSNDEYLAVGFEDFYFGGPHQLQRLRRRMPYLYNVIRRMHLKYRRR